MSWDVTQAEQNPSRQELILLFSYGFHSKGSQEITAASFGVETDQQSSTHTSKTHSINSYQNSCTSPQALLFSISLVSTDLQEGTSPLSQPPVSFLLQVSTDYKINTCYRVLLLTTAVLIRGFSQTPSISLTYQKRGLCEFFEKPELSYLTQLKIS